MAHPSVQEWLFGHPFEGVEDVFRFQEFLQNVGRAFLYRELPSHVSASWDVKGVLRSMGIQCRVPAFFSLFLGAVRIYEEDHHFLQPKVPPTEIFLPFGIRDEDIRDYIGLSGIVISIAKTSEHSSMDGVVGVQPIYTSRCRGSVTFRRRAPQHFPVSLPGMRASGRSDRVPSIGFQKLPHRVTYRSDEAFHLLLRGFSHSELGVFFRFLLSVARDLFYRNEDSVCGIDIAERFPTSFGVSCLLDKASGCVFLVNPESGFITVEHCGGGEDLLLFVDVSS